MICRNEYQAVPIPYITAHWSNNMSVEVVGNKAKANLLPNPTWKLGPMMQYIGKRDDLDEEVEELRRKVEQHQARVEMSLQNEIDKSKEQIVDEFWKDIVSNPPEDLTFQILEKKPGEQTARSWLRDNLDKCFPRAEKLIKKMEVECQFSDVTYETLTHEGFIKALKRAFPYVNWAKPLEEFEALRQKETPKESHT